MFRSSGNSIRNDHDSSGHYPQLPLLFPAGAHRKKDEGGGLPLLSLDRQLILLYEYFCSGGFLCILLSETIKLMITSFALLFTLLVHTIDWREVYQCHTSSPHLCQSMDLYILRGFHRYYLHNPSRMNAFLFIIFTILCMQSIFALHTLYTAIQIMRFFRTRLHIKSSLQLYSWTALLAIIKSKQEEENIFHLSTQNNVLSDFEIVSRIMRRDNYLIGLVAANAIQIDLPHWLPFRTVLHLLLSNTFNRWTEKMLTIFFLNQIFLDNGKLNQRYLSDVKSLRRKFQLMGLLALILTPFLAVLVTYLFALENFQRFYFNREHLTERN